MKCDKCGFEVSPNNDATIIESIAYDNPLIVLFNGARHFLPTENCNGSPSRAQYIENQPRDTRGYKYDSSLESIWREAYAKVQTLYPE